MGLSASLGTPEEQRTAQELANLLSAFRLTEPKRTARRLIDLHGSLRNAVLARECLLPGPEEDVREAMTLVGSLLRAVLAEPLMPLRPLPSMEIIIAHLHAEMAMETVEQFRVIFIGANRHLLAEEIISRGTLDETMMPPREIIHRALQFGASSLILAHNHPSGSPTPSEADIQLTRELSRTCGGLKIDIIDHIIVARPGCFSMSDHGFLSN